MNVTLKSGMRSMYRSPGKTALFALLIFALTVFSYLGASLWAGAEGQLQKCDEEYNTLAVFDYMSSEYPDVWADDTEVRAHRASLDAASVTTEDVIDVQSAGESLAAPIEYKRFVDPGPFKKRSVIFASRCYYVDTHSTWTCVTDSGEAPYMFDQPGAIALMLITENYPDFEFDRSKRYVMHGEYVFARSSLYTFLVEPFPEWSGFADVCPIQEVPDFTTDISELPDLAAFNTMAEIYADINGSVTVYGVESMDTFLPVHQQIVNIASGRDFTPEEYESGAEVCIISEHVATQIGLSIGDSMHLDYLHRNGAGADGISSSEDYEIVGIMSLAEGYYNAVYIPRLTLPDTASDFGYTICTVHVKNGTGSAYADEMRQSQGGRTLITVYDQGYEAVTSGIYALRRTAVSITIVCAVAAVGVLLLFGFSVVYRQQAAVSVMLSLGAGHFKAYVYLLSGAFVISAVASGLGLIAASQLSGVINGFMAGAADVDTSRLLYSNSGVGVIKRINLDAAELPAWINLVPVVLTVAALLVCFIFAALTLKAYKVQKKAKKKKVQAPKKAHASSMLPGGAMKFALLSIRRGGARSLVVPVCAFCLVLFMGALAVSLQTYNDELIKLADKTAINGTFTDTTGRKVGSLVIATEYVDAINDTGYVDEMHTTSSIKYFLHGISMLADGTDTKLEPEYYIPPTNMFVLAGLMDRMARSYPTIVFTNNIRTSPEFYYSTDVLMEFLPGWDETFLETSAEPDNSAFKPLGFYYTSWNYERTVEPVTPCLLPQSYMAKHGIALGDTIEMVMGVEDLVTRSFLVVGSYQKAGVNDTVYAPEAHRPSWMGGSFSSCSFTMNDATDLENLRAWLEDYGFSATGNLREKRETVLLRDADYLRAKKDIEGQISYLETLMPVLMAISCALGFVISYLMMAARRGELAMMRSMGTSKVRVFMSFFLEHAMLCAAGSLLSICARALMGGITAAFLYSTAAFAACYLVGLTICVIKINGEKLLRTLVEPE